MEDKDVRTSTLNVEELWWVVAILTDAIADTVAPEKRQELVSQVATRLHEAAGRMPDGRLRGIVHGASLHLMHFER
ncbi:hypothetical protein RHODGE_RHODGE_03327 [Rhodoplanes serenus]|uniref:Uncharacterized protein n=1 Tax=Rhodoplanes serenus TaxID=200615 RepID=A0A447CXR4_9BRAD|nr:hypothetical protein [Rhodoplanes serenus]VCU10141.1 hypothetical protein RHODGE_RHODGE_03327 [Rhodoplanes serenus]